MSVSNRQLAISDFDLLETLGTGTFSRVRLVRAKADPESLPLALKVIKKAVILKHKQVSHVKEEKALLMRLEHPFIVNLKAAFQDQSHLYLLFEYVPGGELFSRLRDEGLDVSTVRFYASEIVLALAYLHKQHIAYRDLKPENVLLDRCGHVKLSDFGFAKEVRERTFTMCGTPDYIAPEVITRKGHGMMADWWSMGILLYEMTVGYTPFSSETPYATYQRIIAGRVTFSSQFPPVTKTLIKQLLVVSETERLGADPEMVKSSLFFEGVDWEACEKREMAAPWRPRLSSEADTHCFHRYPDSLDSEQRFHTSEMETLFREF